MRFRFLLPLVTSLASLFAACGDNVNPTGSDSTTGTTGTTGTTTTGSGGSGGGGGAMPSPFGLEQRPPNPTCKAPARPSSAPVPVRFDRVFKDLSLGTPMGITQIETIGMASRFASTP